MHLVAERCNREGPAALRDRRHLSPEESRGLLVEQAKAQGRKARVWAYDDHRSRSGVGCGGAGGTPW